MLLIFELTMRKMDLWLKVLLLNKLLKDLKGLMNNMKSDSSSIRSIRKVNNYLVYNVKNIPTLLKQKPSWKIWRSFMIFIQKLSRKLHHSKKLYGMMLVLISWLWCNKQQKNTVINAQICQEIYVNGKPIKNWNCRFKI